MCASVSRMATVAAISPEIAVLEENILSKAEQPLIDTQIATACNLGPCIQYEDAAEDLQNVFQVIFVVNSKAQAESLPNSGCTRVLEQQRLPGDLVPINGVSPVREEANQAGCHDNQEESSQLQAETGSKDETEDVLGWFRSTFSQLERNGVITLKDFKENAKHSDVRRLEQISTLLHESVVLSSSWHYIPMQEFAKHLFSLFDADDNGSISLQELMGGIGRLLW